MKEEKKERKKERKKKERGKERKKEKHFGCLAVFWFGTFAMLFCTTEHVVRHENTRG